VDLEGDDIFWDAADAKVGFDEPGEDSPPPKYSEDSPSPTPIYGAEDMDDMWTLLHWASYNGSPHVKRLFLLKGVKGEHMHAIMLEDNPTLLPSSPFEED
jgi:hypothetical protein